MTAKELRALRAKLVEEAQALIPADGKMTSEVRTKVEAMLADAKSQADMIAFLEAEERSAAETRGRELQLPNVGEHTEKNETTKTAFRSFLKTGETRDLTVASEGVLIPQFVAEPVVAKKSAGYLYDIVGKMATATGAPIVVPTINDTANGFVLNSVSATTTDPSVSHVDLNVDEYRSNPILIDNFLLQDAAFDVEGFVVSATYERYLRDVSKLMTLGNSSNVAGLVDITAGATTAASGKIAYADLVGICTKLDPAYAANACWTMSNATLGAVMQILDANDRPIFLPWNDGPNSGFAGKLLGFPVKLNQYQPAIAADKMSVSFGDFKSGYMLREVQPGIMLKRLSERYAELNKVGFVAFTRFGGAVTDAGTNPILNLKIKA